ncbi:MAG: hypothetical protein U0R51_10995 [Solirubrobacterales bacterium]
MSRPIQFVLYALGAVAVLVVVNWARKDLVVGLVAAVLVIAAAFVFARFEQVADEDES